MDPKTQRKHLRDYTQAARQIDLAGACIDMMETLHYTPAVKRAIEALKGDQSKWLVRLDAAAAKLGAPYGA